MFILFKTLLFSGFIYFIYRYLCKVIFSSFVKTKFKKISGYCRK